MPKTPDRTMLSRLVDAYDRISEESLGMGDPEFHEIEDQLFDAIVDSPYRAVIKNGNIYLPDPNGSPGEIIVVEPAEPEDVDDPESSTSTKTEQGGSALVACGARVACPKKGTRTWPRKKSHRRKTSKIGWGVEERPPNRRPP